MRKLVIIAAFAGLVAATPAAFGHGPSGSREERQACIDDQTGAEVPRSADGTCPAGSTERTVWENNVTCGAGQQTAAGTVYAGPNGAEVCNDGRGALPLQGRIIATSEDGGYVAADGDRDNSAQAQGWVRLDRGGLRCGADDGRRDATHPGPGDTSQNCG